MMSDVSIWHTRLSNGYHKFSDDTSMHGFSELYYAKPYLWKLVWFLIIGAALGITGYQVYEAINQYRYQNYNTVIQPATGDQVIYPPLRFCIPHWIDWIDWFTAYELGFNKETVLIGMSYLTNVYSNHSFDVQAAEENFTATMAAKNLTSIQDFYRAVARPWAVFPPQIFKTKGLLVSDLNNVYFCYTANGSDILKFIREDKVLNVNQQSKTNILTLQFFAMDDDFFGSSHITPEERNSYTAEWIITRTNQYTLDEMTGKDDGFAHVVNDYSKIRPPQVMFIDGYSKSDVKLLPEIDEYLINVRASAHVWKNLRENPCTPGVQSFVSDSSCLDYCSALASYCPLTCSRLEKAILLPHVDELSKLCKYNVYFIHRNDKNNIAENVTETLIMDTSTRSSSSSKSSSSKRSTEASCIYNEKLINEKIAKCTEGCTEGCEKWSYDITVNTRSIYSSIHTVAHKTSTSIYVQYPLDGDILIMTETDSQSWENLVGNVGGLLGIWTGASVISVFQLFYLCCCAEMTCSECCCPRRFAAGNNGLRHVGEKPEIIVGHISRESILLKKKRPKRLNTILIKS